MEDHQNTPKIRRKRRKRRILTENRQYQRNISKEFSPQKQENEYNGTRQFFSRNSPPENNNSIEKNLQSRKFRNERKNISGEFSPEEYNSLKLQKARKRIKNTSSDESQDSCENFEKNSNDILMKSKQTKKRVKNNCPYSC